MADRSVCYIKSNPGFGYVVGQVLITKPDGAIWSPKELGDEPANADGLALAVAVLDLARATIQEISSPDQIYLKGFTRKVNDVDNPTDLILV